MVKRKRRSVVRTAAVVGYALAVSSVWAITAETPDPAVATSFRAFNGDLVHVFTNSGTFKVTEPGSVRLLVVGGGGGGADGGGGGGGGGQMVEQTLDLDAGDYAVTIGAGGAPGANGEASSFGTLVSALGGGKGGVVNSGGGKGANGGGGGGRYQNTTAGGAATAGFAGGQGAHFGGGGGGGAGGVGGDSSMERNDFSRCEGAGGPGAFSDITGAPTWYAAGGGGGGYNGTYGAYGGRGGGGSGGDADSLTNAYSRGHAGAPNTGSGGGGGGRYGNTIHDGAAGGSGVVIVRYSDGTVDPVADTDLPMATVNGAASTRVLPDGSIVHVFTGDGALTVEQGGAIELLLVGGGGGGSVQNSFGAGGGAGGLILTNLTVAPGTYGVRVGAGGLGALQVSDDLSVTNSGDGVCGEPSCFGGDAANARFGFVALGGGGTRQINKPGLAGGSGGGGGRRNSGTVTESGPGFEGQGHAGGFGCVADAVYGDITCPQSCGGGGGGAGEPGHDGFEETTYGQGGDGLLIDITGEPVWYAGGGGAGNNDAGSSKVGSCAGGLGGGGAGGCYMTPAESGVDGTGGGGGGGAGGGNDDSLTTRSTPGGNGGRGVVVVRYKAKWGSVGEAEGGAVKRVKGKYVHTFTSSGTFTVKRAGHYEFFLVGGGGGGGHFGGGGGGAGGVVLTNGYLLAGDYAVTVGQGGTCGRNGEGSSVASFVAVGGGGGGDYPSVGHLENIGRGGNGGSGGGSSRPYGGQKKFEPSGLGVAGQGFDGGTGRACLDANGDFATVNGAGRVHAGGGGGAGGPGHDGYLPDEANGGFIDENGCVSTAFIADARGGDGVMCDFNGVEKWYAGGGGGGLNCETVTLDLMLGSGGKGGGGHGAGCYGSEPNNLLRGQDGEPNTGGGGGGGGGAGTNTQYDGGTGGSGIVMIRYVGPMKGAYILVR